MPTEDNIENPTPVLKLRRFRIGDRIDLRRQTPDQENNAGLSEKDSENIDAFAQLVDEAAEILRAEVDGIKQGNFDIITQLFDRKSAVLKAIELQIPLVQPFIESRFVQSRNLSKRLEALAISAKEGADLLERMAQAAGTVATEIRRATERHSLNGLYGITGQKLGKSALGTKKIDEQL